MASFMRAGRFMALGLFVFPALEASACAAFRGEADTESSPDASSDVATSATDGGIGADAAAIETDAAETDGGNGGCAVLCDDFERATLTDATHNWVKTETRGTIALVGGVLQVSVPGVAYGGTPNVTIVQFPDSHPPSGEVLATVDLDLTMTQRGFVGTGFTNVMSVDFDDAQASFAIYLDANASVQCQMQTDVARKSILVTVLNEGQHHLRLEGTFRENGNFDIFVDGARAGGSTLKARAINLPHPRVELGARQSTPRGANEFTVDNFRADVRRSSAP